MSKPRKRFGQHFLVDRNIVDKIIRAVKVDNDNCLIEIGPGRGALTALLAAKTPRFSVIEIDRDLAAKLQQKYTVYNTDVLAFDFNAHDCAGKLQLAGNLPYNISSPLLFYLYNYRARIYDMVFMVQMEVGERIAAREGCKQYGRLAVMSQAVCRVEKLFQVPSSCFYPRPKVDSLVIRLTVKPAMTDFDLAGFSTLVKTCFAMRRKTLKNNLKGMTLPASSPPVDLAQRAEQLGIDDFLKLFAWRQSL